MCTRSRPTTCRPTARWRISRRKSRISGPIRSTSTRPPARSAIWPRSSSRASGSTGRTPRSPAARNTPRSRRKTRRRRRRPPRRRRCSRRSRRRRSCSEPKRWRASKRGISAISKRRRRPSSMPDMAADDFKHQFEDALALRVAGNPQEAVRRLDSLLAGGERAATLAGTIGTILLTDMHAPGRAVPYLRRTVALSPRSELASLNLCRALIATGQMKAASEEARRYLGLKESEEHRRLLASSEAPGAGEPHLVVVLLVETSRLPDPYAAVRAGLAAIKARLRAGVAERLDLYLVTVAGRVWSVTRLKDVSDDAKRNDLGTAGQSDVEFRRDGLLWGLLRGARAAHAALAELRSRGRSHLRPWLVTLTAGETGPERRRVLEKCRRILRPLRDDRGLNVLPVLT